jgi:hypothetical protein
MRIPQSVVDRIETRWKKDGSCWRWLGSFYPGGYGKVHVNRVAFGAHVIMYRLFHPEADTYLSVLHTCDNKWCVNPKHLFLGTHSENMRDMQLKGRGNTTKVAPNTVKKIRESPLSCRAAGRKFGLSKAQISKIRNHKCWDYVS